MGLKSTRSASKRRPDRSRSHATVSMIWEIYDKLDDLALKNGLSLADTIEALVDEYTTRKGCDEDA